MNRHAFRMMGCTLLLAAAVPAGAYQASNAPTTSSAPASGRCSQSLPGIAMDASTPANIATLSQEFGALYIPMESTRVNAARVGRESFRRGFDENPEILSVVNSFPGLFDRLEATTVGIIVDCVNARIPDAQARIAVIAAAHFTAAELQQIISFYRSPTGQAIMQSMVQGMDAPTDLVDDTGTVREVTARDMVTMARSGMRQMAPAERIALLRFSTSPVGRKFDGLAAELIRSTTESVNLINAQSAPLIQQAALDEIAKALESAPAADK